MSSKNLFLLSGLLCDDTVWNGVAEQLSHVCNTPINITMVSFAGLNSIEAMASKVLAQAPASFMLVGHSMGGRVALEIMQQAPERVTQLGLFNTGVHPRRESELAGRAKLLDIGKTQGMAAVAKTWLPPMMGSTGLNDKKLMASLEKMVENYSYDQFHSHIQALLNRPNAEAVLPNVNIPTLLLSGSEDKWSPPSQHLEMQKILPQSHFSEIPGAGHMAPVEHPKLVALEIKKWMIEQ